MSKVSADADLTKDKKAKPAFNWFIFITSICLLYFAFISVPKLIQSESSNHQYHAVNFTELTNNGKVYKFDQSAVKLSNAKKSLDIPGHVNNNSESIYRLKHSFNNSSYYELVELIEDTRTYKEPTFEVQQNGNIVGKSKPLSVVGVDINDDKAYDFFGYADDNGHYKINISGISLPEKERLTASIIVPKKQQSANIQSHIKVKNKKVYIEGKAPENATIIITTPNNKIIETKANSQQEFAIELGEKDRLEGNYSLIAKDSAGNFLGRSTEMVNLKEESWFNFSLPSISVFNVSNERKTKLREKTEIIEQESTIRPEITKNGNNIISIIPDAEYIEQRVMFTDISGKKHQVIAHKSNVGNWFLNNPIDGLSINRETGVLRFTPKLLNNRKQISQFRAYKESLKYVRVYPCSTQKCEFQPLAKNLNVNSDQLAFDAGFAFKSAVICSMLLGLALLVMGAGNFSVYIGLSGVFLVRYVINISKTFHDIRISSYVSLSFVELLVIPLFFALIFGLKSHPNEFRKKAIGLGVTSGILMMSWWKLNTSDINGLTNSIAYATSFKLQPILLMDVVKIFKSISTNDSYPINVIFIAVFWIATLFMARLHSLVAKYNKNNNSSRTINLGLIALVFLVFLFSIIGVQIYAVLSIFLVILVLALYPENSNYLMFRKHIVENNQVHVKTSLKQKFLSFLNTNKLAIFIWLCVSFILFFNIKREYGATLIVLMFCISTFIIARHIQHTLAQNTKDNSIKWKTHISLLSSIQLSGMMGILLIIALLILKHSVLTSTTTNVVDKDGVFNDSYEIPKTVLHKVFYPALIEKTMWESKNYDDSIKKINDIRVQAQEDFTGKRFNQNVRMRLYGWLVGQPYNAIMWPATMARIESIERVKASSIPDADNLYFGDKKLAKRYLFEENSLKSGVDYEHAIGLYYIKPFGMFGMLVLVFSFLSIYRGLAYQTVAKIFICTLTMVTTWIILQTQGVLPALGINSPFVVSNSFAKDLFPLAILFLTISVFFSNETSNNKNPDGEES